FRERENRLSVFLFRMPSPRESVAEGAGDLADVARPEKVHVHEERVKLVEREAPFVTWREGPSLAVRVEDAGAESAEKTHHGEIDLAVPAVDGGVDEAGPAALVGVEVAAPEIAVHPRGWLAGADQ